MKRAHRKGFALIELIIVIAIIAILAAILIPSIIGYVSDTQESVCDFNMKTIQREAIAQSALREAKTTGEIKAIYDRVIKAYIDGGQAPCPAGGVYTTDVDSEEQVYVSCSIHGKALTDPDKIQLMINNEDIMAVIDGYFGIPDSALVGGKSIDSTADFSGAFADQINRVLKKLGIGEDCAYRIYKKYNPSTKTYNYTLTWCSTDITKLTPGDTVMVTQYDMINGTYRTGNVRIGTNTTC